MAGSGGATVRFTVSRRIEATPRRRMGAHDIHRNEDPVGAERYRGRTAGGCALRRPGGTGSNTARALASVPHHPSRTGPLVDVVRPWNPGYQPPGRCCPRRVPSDVRSAGSRHPLTAVLPAGVAQDCHEPRSRCGEGRVWGIHAPGSELTFGITEDQNGGNGPKAGEPDHGPGTVAPRRGRCLAGRALHAALCNGSTHLRMGAQPSIGALASAGVLWHSRQ
jgi:hypothetical protein